jgi:hypothetical protein
MTKKDLDIFLVALGTMLCLVFLLFDNTYLFGLSFIFTIAYCLMGVTFDD